MYQLYVFRRRVCRRLEGLGLAIREGWEVEKGLAGRGRGDHHERIEEYCFIDNEGNIYIASIKWVFQVMENGGGGSGLRALRKIILGKLLEHIPE